jgi:hypothetical protein
VIRNITLSDPSLAAVEEVVVVIEAEVEVVAVVVAMH